MQEEQLTELNGALRERLADAKAYIFDMDGTLVLGSPTGDGYVALPGAIAFLNLLRSKNIPFRVFTNGTAKSPPGYASALRMAGLDIRDEDMMTPATAAAIWFKKNGISRIRLLGGDGARVPLEQAGLQVHSHADDVSGIEAVFTASTMDLKFSQIHLACQDIWNGALAATATDVRFFASRGGRAVSVSYAINQTLRGLTGKTIKVLGKPSKSSLHCALSLMGMSNSLAAKTVVVGDDPALEMRLANVSGAIGVAVTTGITTREEFEALAAPMKPHCILQGMDVLVRIAQ